MKDSIRLTVIIPAYNEEKTIQQVLTQVLAQKDVFEVIVVDDASKDKTAVLAKKKKVKRLHVYSHTENQGKGKAIQTALRMAKGNYILIQDADLEYDPKEIPKLLEPIRLGRVEVVYGSRFFGARTNMYYWHYVGNQLLNLFINVLYDTILSDMETCYKILPTQLMKDLKLSENDFRIEPEITCKLLLRGVKILEIPITYIGRTYAEGKKITGIDWILAVGAILKYRLSTI
ncbi:MAG: glycosyltransferase family 2 protein [Candidatus Pacebacteria bacterium]|nr:glycosyltransferase family 2 protein [Candidatus Paceibacterota bacterium]